VGHHLALHEHRHRFGKTCNPNALEAGGIITIEPGYYREDSFGLRTENQAESVPGAPGFLRFETLTLVPIDLTMADPTQLTPSDVQLIDRYHERMRTALLNGLSMKARGHLAAWTRPIGLLA
jgi:Xaa-Pro aminopeptidase